MIEYCFEHDTWCAPKGGPVEIDGVVHCGTHFQDRCARCKNARPGKWPRFHYPENDSLIHVCKPCFQWLVKHTAKPTKGTDKPSIPMTGVLGGKP